MKNIWKQIFKIDKNFLLLLLFATLAPIIYSSLRLTWVTDNGGTNYAMTSFNSYIQATLEVFTAFLIIPMFMYRKSEYEKKCNSILFSIFLASILIFFILTILIFPIIKSMEEMNPEAKRKDLIIYLLLIAASDSFSIIETYLICEIAFGKETFKGILATTIGILIKILIDLLMFSKFSIIDFSIVNVAISSFISTMLMLVALLVVYFLKQKKLSSIKKVKIAEVKEFYKKGFLPGIDKLIANFFYAFVTLKIVNNLGETEWNSWHLGMFIYWNIIFKITYIFKYSLLSESINNTEISKEKITILYSIFDIIIFLILGPLLSLTILKNVVDDGEWLKLTIMTSLVMIPFMLSMAIGDNLKVSFLVENKFKYILFNTILSNFLIEFPILILLFCGIDFSYIDNFIIWMSVILFSFIINVAFYVKLNKKWDLKTYINKRRN